LLRLRGLRLLLKRLARVQAPLAVFTPGAVPKDAPGEARELG